VFLNYPCIPSPSINPDNRDYTVVPTVPFESPKGPSDEKCLGPANPLIRPWEPLEPESRQSYWLLKQVVRVITNGFKGLSSLNIQNRYFIVELTVAQLSVHFPPVLESRPCSLYPFMNHQFSSSHHILSTLILSSHLPLVSWSVHFPSGFVNRLCHISGICYLFYSLFNLFFLFL
jgi:hypothetical protein